MARSALLTRASVVAVFSLVLASQAPQPRAQQIPAVGGLFADAPLLEPSQLAAISALAPDASVERSRLVTINFSQLFVADPSPTSGSVRGSLLLNLFDDVSFNASFDRLDVFERGVVWTGHLDGVPLSTATLSTLDGVMSATILAPGRVYTVRYLGSGIHRVSQIDQSQFAPEAEPLRVAAKMDLEGLVVTPSPDTGGTIDIMVLYTPAAVTAAGGSSAITTLVNLGVSETNTSYANSSVTQRVRLVYSGQIAYTENGSDIASDLYNLTNNPVNALGNAVASLRDAYGADIVSMWGSGYNHSGGACGVGWQPDGPSTDASFGFDVVDQSCVSPNYSFEHEMGHNMSAQHDWYVDPSVNFYTYSHGHVYPGGGWRTIMSYNDLCAAQGASCTRLLYWSNPSLTNGGAPLGVAGGTKTVSCFVLNGTATSCDADDHRTLNNTAAYVANWRVSVVPPSITTQPTSRSIANGQNASFTIAANGTPGPTYQWQISTNAGASWTDLTTAAPSPYSGITTTTLTVTTATVGFSGAQYRCVATNSAGSATSAAATLTVTAPTTVLVNRYRLYSPVTLEHLYTTDLNEYNTLGTPPYFGIWQQESVASRMHNGPVTVGVVQAVPYYRLYDFVSRWHHWTTDRNEYDTLRQYTSRYNAEGIDGYIFQSQVSGSVPWYRLLYPGIPGLHTWTADQNERDTLVNQRGWIEEQKEYVFP